MKSLVGFANKATFIANGLFHANACRYGYLAKKISDSEKRGILSKYINRGSRVFKSDNMY